MSAFVVSKTHIDGLITAGLELGRRGPLRWFYPPLDRRWTDHDHERSKRELRLENADDVGQMLVAECVRSVAHRYPDCAPQLGGLPGPCEAYYLEPYQFVPLRGRVEPSVALKAIACYRYQSCEHPEWNISEAYQFCDALEQAAIWALPGMDQAPGWEITDREVFLKNSVRGVR